jgi:hypothetical protein
LRRSARHLVTLRLSYLLTKACSAITTVKQQVNIRSGSEGGARLLIPRANNFGLTAKRPGKRNRPKTTLVVCRDPFRNRTTRWQNHLYKARHCILTYVSSLCRCRFRHLLRYERRTAERSTAADYRWCPAFRGFLQRFSDCSRAGGKVRKLEHTHRAVPTALRTTSAVLPLEPPDFRNGPDRKCPRIENNARITKIPGIEDTFGRIETKRLSNLNIYRDCRHWSRKYQGGYNC